MSTQSSSTTARLVAKALAACVALARGALVATAVLGLAGAAHAEDKARIHVVYAGQRLQSIAKRYNVTVDELCRANDIRASELIKPGQRLVIPSRQKRASADRIAPPKPAEAASDPRSRAPTPTEAVQVPPTPRPPASQSPEDCEVHVVQPGQRLGSIARRYNLSITAICEANHIDRKATLSVGQRLLLPGIPRKSAPRAKTPKPASRGTRSVSPELVASWQPYIKAPWRAGYVDLRGFNASFKGYMIGPKGDLLPLARQNVSRVLSGAKGTMDPRLIQLIAKVSDRFGGRPLRIVSGYRQRSYAAASRHRVGKALDFSIPGVPNTALRDYLRTFRNAGVGYYPNSSFVHLDVREGAAYWVDYSRPGQPPIYRRSSALARASTQKKAPTESGLGSPTASPPSDARAKGPEREEEPEQHGAATDAEPTARDAETDLETARATADADH